jgi:hypothetical protein
MQHHRIVVRVSPDGIITAETQGMKGPKCLDVIEVLENLLDAQTVNSAFTHEYDQTPIEMDDEVRNDLKQR